MLAIDFLNTIWADRAGVHDALATPAEVAGWLERAGILSTTRVSRTDAEQVRLLRDAGRRLAAETSGDSREPASAPLALTRALAVLNAATAQAPRWSQLSWPAGGPPARSSHSGAPPMTTALAVIAEHLIDLVSSPKREQVGACNAPGCVLYFLRENPRQAWCSSQCGNRARVARHYQRHHEMNHSER